MISFTRFPHESCRLDLSFLYFLKKVLGRPERNVLQWSNLERINADTSVFLELTEGRWRIEVMRGIQSINRQTFFVCSSKLDHSVSSFVKSEFPEEEEIEISLPQTEMAGGLEIGNYLKSEHVRIVSVLLLFGVSLVSSI